MKNIITLSGDPGSGKSTTRNALKEYYEKQGKKVIIYSVGDIFRELAEKEGLNVTEFNQFLQKSNTNVDEQIDKAVQKFGKMILEENDENKIYIIDSRMAWSNIPESIKIRLTTTADIAGKRIFSDETRGIEDKFKTLEEAIKITQERKESERQRYLDIYDKDLENLENYDLVIDTSYANTEDIVDIVVRCLDAENKQQKFSKYWKSPKQFMPIQSIYQTLQNNAHSKMTLEEWKEKILHQGVDIDQPIAAIKVGETYFVRDGHHRNFGAACAGKTLVPYEVKWTDESNYHGMSARTFITMSVLGDHKYDRDLYAYEDLISRNGENFYYYLVYPGIEKGKVFEGYNKKTEGQRTRRQ